MNPSRRSKLREDLRDDFTFLAEPGRNLAADCHAYRP